MNPNRMAAVINCGSSSIRLVVAEFPADSSLRVIENAVKFLSLGREVYTGGLIRRRTMTLAIQIFLQYKELLEAYSLKPEDVRVIGTSALREARNKDSFIDRVEVRTGFRINVIDGIEENRLTYMAVQFALKDEIAHINKFNSIIVEVGGGSTELILQRRGMICAVHSLSFGTIRIEENYKDYQSSRISPQTLKQNLAHTIELLDDEMKLSSIKYFVAMGNYARLAAEIWGSPEQESLVKFTKDQWQLFATEVNKMTPEQCVKNLGVSQAAAEGFGSALLAYLYILEDTTAEELYIPQVGISEGLLMELGPGIDPAIQSRFLAQVRSSALSLGKRFHFDLEHAKHVTEMSLILFDQLSREHNLGPRQRLLLEVAALLHDIGTYIKPSGHHKHSQYLVENSEVFGLEPRDASIVGNVVRYHRKSLPLPTHPSYMSLPREDRLIVLKLAAILRVADALDRGHTQKIRNLRIEKKEDEIQLWADYHSDVSAERFSLADKGLMFEEVFGLKVSLV